MAEKLSGVRLSDEETRLAAYLVRAGVAAIERQSGTLPAAAVRLRDQLDMFARRISYAQASAESEPANLPACPDPAESASLLHRQISVTAAAALAGVSRQHIRRLCRRGVLIAAWSPAGTWQIELWSLEELAARRRKEAS